AGRVQRGHRRLDRRPRHAPHGAECLTVPGWPCWLACGFSSGHGRGVGPLPHLPGQGGRGWRELAANQLTWLRPPSLFARQLLPGYHAVTDGRPILVVKQQGARMREFQVVGRAIPRVDGDAKVTGGACYAADVVRPGMLWAKALRSPHPHARVRRLDEGPALALPGVHAVITGANTPATLIGRAMQDMPVLPRDRVCFAGQMVAVVAAEDPDVAEEAASLVDVEYELLPAVFDPLEAMQPQAPVLHTAAAIRAAANAAQQVPDLPNTLSIAVWGKGDVTQGFAAADHVFEHTFRTQVQHQTYLEPHACLAEVDATGVVHVWASNKAPAPLRRTVARALDFPLERVVVHPVYVGGDFGGKGSFMNAPHCALLAVRTGRPVKMVMSY